jgi:hypothetical protein
MRKLIALLTLAFATSTFVLMSVKADPVTPVVKADANRDFDADLHNKCLYPTIRVTNTGITQKSSGFIVRSEKFGDDYYNVALTCNHCINDPDENFFADIPVYEKDGTTFKKWDRYPLIVYAQNESLDVAILLFRTPTKQPTVELDFARKLCIGNEIFHFGCGMGEEPRLEIGRVTSLKGKVGRHPADVLRTSVFTVFGDSGGPTFYKNKVVGMTQAIKVTTFRGFPAMVNGISMVIPIGAFKTWDEQENQTLGFIHNPKAGLPRLPYAMLKWQTIDWEKIEHEEGE